jgi:hypothetical protein
MEPEAAELEGLLARLRAAGPRLRALPVSRVAHTLGHVGERFARAGDPLREEALALLPAFAGVSPGQASLVLDGMARDWTEARLRMLLEAELGDPRALDGFVDAPPRPGAEAARRRVRALGPRLAFHVCAGTVPGVSVTSLVRGLLAKGPLLLKPGAGDVVLPVLFVRALAAADGEAGRTLADAVAVAYWPGGPDRLERPALEAADLVVVHGGDETVRQVGGRLPATARLVAYPHRVSLAVIGRAALEGAPADAAARDLARAVATFDQRGCVSPQQAFLLGAGPDEAAAFGGRLARALDAEAVALPPGPLEPERAAAIQQLRATAELRAAAGQAVHVLGGRELSWTVVVDPEPALRASCLGRSLHVTPLVDLDALRAALAPVAAHLQSVGIAGLGVDEARTVEALADAGVTRVAPIDDLPFPPAWWLHDGMPPLGSLLRWSEWSGA